MTDTPHFLIRDVTIIKGNGDDPISQAAVLVEGKRIAWIGPASDAPQIAERYLIGGEGGTLLPGLIDCHVHLCNDGTADFVGQVLSDSVPMATIRAYLGGRLSLDHGVTTVRDCGAANSVALELSQIIEAGMIPGPRIIAAGRVITMTGGHCHFFGHEVDGADEARKATRVELKGGSHFIKVMATGGALTPGVEPGQTALNSEELRAVVEEAHNAGRRVASHAIGNAGIKNALRVGVDSVEHACYLDDDALDLALTYDAFIVPTLVAINAVIKHGIAGGIPEHVVRKAMLQEEPRRASFGAAVRSGLKIAAGTDAGTPFNTQGTLAQEIATMVEYGFSPMAAIVAATRNAALNLDLGDKIGAIETGKFADMIVVDGDPLKDISALERVRFVSKEGTIYKNELDVATDRLLTETVAGGGI